MERLLTWIRDNPQFAAITFAVTVLVLVMTVLALTMARSGASLRPLIWFLGFIAIIAGPQAVVHLLDGFVLRRARATQPEKVSVATSREFPFRSPVAWDVVFGPDADPALITDAKHGLAAILGEAKEAKLSFSPDGSSALAARFDSARSAARALDAYGTFFAFTKAQGTDADGWTARRHAGQGEWVHVVAAGPELYAWTGASRESVLARRAHALGPVQELESVVPTGGGASGPQLVSKKLSSQMGLMLGIVSLNLLVAGLWFFKGSAWASRVDGSRAAMPTPAAMLRDDLMALSHRGAPTQVTALPDGTIEITWRYADARWFDLMRLHQMKRAFRLVLNLDEPTHTVRVREYWSAFDASADARTLRLDWKAATGIQFFAFEHKRVLGAQLGSDGKPTGELSKAYTFNLQALKSPIIDVVTSAGWRWQPVTWNALASLRWLTE